MGLVLFETSESVIELLWDIALAFFILRIAFIYFLLTFTSGALLTYFFADRFLPATLFYISMEQSELLVLGLHLLLMTVWARFCIVYFEVPRVKGFRLAIGLVAGVFMFLAETLLGFVLYKYGHGGWILESEPEARWAWATSLAVFSLLPVMMTAVERVPTDECDKCHAATSHGHEKKSVTAAV